MQGKCHQPVIPPQGTVTDNMESHKVILQKNALKEQIWYEILKRKIHKTKQNKKAKNPTNQKKTPAKQTQA